MGEAKGGAGGLVKGEALCPVPFVMPVDAKQRHGHWLAAASCQLRMASLGKACPCAHRLAQMGWPALA